MERERVEKRTLNEASSNSRFFLLPFPTQTNQITSPPGVRSVDKKGKEILYDIENKINFSVFPGLQGGPHNHTIAGLACALHQAKGPEFIAYQKQVLANSKALADGKKERGFFGWGRERDGERARGREKEVVEKKGKTHSFFILKKKTLI